MSCRLALSACAVLLPLTSFAQSVTPRTREVPSAYRTIQSAIDSARSGDSVLVAPGHYRENIRFNGKSIVLASRFARTRDPQDILNTVIDGTSPAHPDSGSTVVIADREDSTTVLEGFTIIGGPGTVWYDIASRQQFQEGGGVLCELSSPTIRFNRILAGRAVTPRSERVRSSGGGGIRCGFAEPTIEANLIAGNRGRYGAGMVIFHSAAVIRRNLILANVGGEDFGGAGVWMVGNFSRRLGNELANNTIVGNVVADSDPGAPNTMRGKGGGVLVARVNVQSRDNLVAANVQASVGQYAVGPGVVGAIDGLRAVLDPAPQTVGPWALPDPSRTTDRGALDASCEPETCRVLLALARAADSWAIATVTPDLAVRRAELLAADSTYGRITAHGIARRLAAPLLEDAVVVGPRTTLWRRAADVRAALDADTANAQATVRWAPIRGDVSADGTEGYTFGYLDISGGSSPRREWKYVAYWRRASDGRWRMAAHKRLPRAPGATETAPPDGFALPTSRVAPWFPAGNAELGRLLAHDSAFARAAQRDVGKAFHDYTAEQGATFSSGPQFAWGRAGVAAAFSAFTPGTIDWAPDVAGLAPSGDLGFATGEVVVRERQSDGQLREVARARYLTVWQRQPDGAWRLIIDG